MNSITILALNLRETVISDVAKPSLGIIIDDDICRSEPLLIIDIIDISDENEERKNILKNINPKIKYATKNSSL